MAGIVEDNVWVLNGSAENRSRQEASWFARSGLESTRERMSEWGRIIRSLPKSMGPSDTGREGESENR